MVIDPVLIVLAFSAGMIAFLNPCGLAMLPSYVSYYLSRENGQSIMSKSILQGIGFGAIMTLGFVSVFATGGAILSYLGSRVIIYSFWMTLIIGVILILLGFLMLINRSFSLTMPIKNPIKAPVKKGYSSIYLFGVGYAIASLSCTIPIFIMVVSTALSTGGFVNGTLIFLAYSLGMGSVMILLSIAVATSKELILRHLNSAMLYIKRISALILIVAGIYLIYFQLFVNRLLGL